MLQRGTFLGNISDICISFSYSHYCGDIDIKSIVTLKASPSFKVYFLMDFSYVQSDHTVG